MSSSIACVICRPWPGPAARRPAACRRASARRPRERPRRCRLRASSSRALSASTTICVSLLLSRPASISWLWRALGRGHLVEPHGAVVDLALHLEHLAEAGFEHGQHPLDLLLAKLAEDLLQLGLGLLQLADGLFLLLDRALALGLVELLLGPPPCAAGPLRAACGPDSGRHPALGPGPGPGLDSAGRLGPGRKAATVAARRLILPRLTAAGVATRLWEPCRCRRLCRPACPSACRTACRPACSPWLPRAALRRRAVRRSVVPRRILRPCLRLRRVAVFLRLGLFVLLDLAGQLAGLVGQLLLFAGELLRIVAARGAALDVLLLLDDGH